jgi:WD40 repeat protein
MHFLLTVACALSLAGLRANADEPDGPVLRIESGAHTAVAHGLAVSWDGSRIATSSFDGTVRIWSVPELKPVRTIRMPIGPGDEGAVYTVAFSPDDKTLITSGWTGGWANKDGPWCFYIIDLSAGDITKTVCDLPRRANHAAFSPDGKYLAFALKLDGGVRVYRTADFSVVPIDTRYSEASDWVEFDRNGQMVTTSFDGMLRLYNNDFHLKSSVRMPENRKPDQLSISPDGSLIAVGYFDPEDDDHPSRAAIDLVSMVDLSILSRPDLKGVDNGALWRVAWSANGTYLYAAGTYTKGERFQVRRWADRGAGKPFDISASSSRILRMLPLPKGGVVFQSDVPYMGVIDSHDRVMAERQTTIADFREIGDVFSVSADGFAVQFAFEPSGRKPAHFSLLTRVLELGKASVGAGMVQPILDDKVLDVRGVGGYTPTLNGGLLPLHPHEQSLALAFFPDRKSFMLGTLWSIRRIDSRGEVLWETLVPYSARGVLVTPDMRLVLAAIGDGTIRWYAADTGKELLAFFPHADGQRWVAWTPSGYYVTSVGGETLVGWQVNRDHAHAADFFSVGRFHEKYYRPDIVQKTLTLLDEDQAIREANLEIGRNNTSLSTAQLLPPVIGVLDPSDGAPISHPVINVRYFLRSPSGAPIDEIIIRSDDHLIGTEEKTPPLDSKGETTGVLNNIIVPQRDSKLLLFAKNQYAVSEPAVVQLRWAGPPLQLDSPRKIYVLAIGITNYKDQKYNLTFAAKDASDLVKAIDKQKTKAFSDVIPNILIDDNATRSGIRNGFAWLDEIVGPNDIGLIFLAGHGLDGRDRQFFYLPYEADVEQLSSTAISSKELLVALEKIKGSTLLFIDTCHAGDVFGRIKKPSMDVIGLVSELSQPSNGVIVYAAATGNQIALETPIWKNGAFTKAVVEALEGQPEHLKHGYVTNTMLEAYVEERVKDLTANHQTPTWNKPLGVPDLLMARFFQ